MAGFLRFKTKNRKFLVGVSGKNLKSRAITCPAFPLYTRLVCCKGFLSLPY